MQIKINGNQYDEHVYECGSRTKVCELCRRNVLIREFDGHQDTCTGPVPVFVKKEEAPQRPAYQDPYALNRPMAQQQQDPRAFQQNFPAMRPAQEEKTQEEAPVVRSNPAVQKPVASTTQAKANSSKGFGQQPSKGASKPLGTQAPSLQKQPSLNAPVSNPSQKPAAQKPAAQPQKTLKTQEPKGSQNKLPTTVPQQQKKASEPSVATKN